MLRSTFPMFPIGLPLAPGPLLLLATREILPQGPGETLPPLLAAPSTGLRETGFGTGCLFHGHR